MDHQEPGTTEGAAPPRRKLQVARETLRQLGARTLRNAVGGTFYTWGPPDCDYSQNNPAECFTQDYYDCTYTQAPGCDPYASMGDSCECTAPTVCDAACPH